MAFVAMRRLASRNGIALRRPLGSAISCVTRSYCDAHLMGSFENRQDDRSNRVPVFSRRDAFFNDVYNPFSPRSVSRPVNLMARRGGGAVKWNWEAREDEDTLWLKVDMPGLGREDVKVKVKHDTLIIKGEKAGADAEVSGNIDFDLPPNKYYLSIEAEMKNGVLKAFVPKLQEDNRVNVSFH